MTLTYLVQHFCVYVEKILTAMNIYSLIYESRPDEWS